MTVGKAVQFLKACTNSCERACRLRACLPGDAARDAFTMVASPFCLTNLINLRARRRSCDEGGYVDGLAVALIVKDEARYLDEFVAFHVLQGVDRFYIFDNGSTDGTEDVLRDYIENGLVRYQKLPGTKRQNDAYNIALKKCFGNTKYLAAIDADEFLMAEPTSGGGLVNTLDEIFLDSPDAGAVGINWLVYGSAGLDDRDMGGFVTEDFLYRAEDGFAANSHIKCVVRPERALAFPNPHYPVLMPGYRLVDEGGATVEGPKAGPRHSRLRINHYYCKSRAEYDLKLKRGVADKVRSKRSAADFSDHDRNDVYDPVAKLYSSEVRMIVSRTHSRGVTEL